MQLALKLATLTSQTYYYSYAKTDRPQGTILARIRSHFIFTTVLHFSYRTV